MTLAVMKTKVELGIASEFERIADRLPGGGAVRELRRRALAVFATHGLPNRQVEEYKYTDLRTALREALPAAVDDEARLEGSEVTRAIGAFGALDATRVVLVNGRYRAELSDMVGGSGLQVVSLAQTLAAAPEPVGAELLAPLGSASESIAALNSAFATDGVVVRVSGELEKPLLIIHLETGPARHVTTRNAIVAKPGAKACVLEIFAALEPDVAGQVSAATDVTAGDGAALTHLKVVLNGATHLATLQVRLGAGTIYRGFQYTERTELARTQSFISLDGEDAKLDVSGAMLGRGTDHIDSTMLIDHAAPGCEGRELFKTVLDGKARAVFQGKVIVRQIAQKTDGKQMAQALMLSEDAEFDSKPELEIYADDVLCGHGSTSAEIDPQMLFYLRTRGIPLPEARAMLIRSFVGEAIEKVEHEAIRDALTETAGRWLDGNA